MAFSNEYLPSLLAESPGRGEEVSHWPTVHELHSSRASSERTLTWPQQLLKPLRGNFSVEVSETDVISYLPSGGTTENRARLRPKIQSHHKRLSLPHAPPPSHTYYTLNTWNSSANQARCFCRCSALCPRRCLILLLEHSFFQSLTHANSNTFLGSQRQAPFPSMAPPSMPPAQRWSYCMQDFLQ